MSTLRDADRILGHSYYSEVGPPCLVDWCDNRANHHHVERMTPREQFVDAIGCAAQMVGALVGAIVVWALLVALFLGVR